MTSSFLVSALAIISVLTTLTVEAIKTVLDERKKSYSSNVLAICVSIGITLIGSILYIIYDSVPVTPQIIVTIIALIYLSFLTATVGFDKVKQLLKQIGGK